MANTRYEELKKMADANIANNVNKEERINSFSKFRVKKSEDFNDGAEMASLVLMEVVSGVIRECLKGDLFNGADVPMIVRLATSEIYKSAKIGSLGKSYREDEAFIENVVNWIVSLAVKKKAKEDSII